MKGVDDERLRLMAEERFCHDAATQMAMSVARSCADVHHCHEAVAQAAESAVRLLAKDRRRHEATELATMSPMRSLTASQDRANIEAIAYGVPALPTTTSPDPPAMLSPSPRPTSLYLGAVRNTNGGGHLSPHSTSPTVAVSTLRSVVKEVLAERTSTNDKEADGRTRALPPTDTTATANGEDTQRPVTDDATPRRVMAKSNTPGMWTTSDDTSSSPELTTAATLTETLSSSPRPTTYVGAVLSNMGERAHVTPLAVAPSPQSSAEPHPSAADGHLGMVRCRTRPRRRTGRCHRPRAPSPLNEVLSSPPIPTLGGGLPLCTVNTQQTVRRRYRPRRRHGCRHQPRAPNPSCDEAPPSHPHPKLGGTSTPTIALPTRSARAMYLLRSESSSISLFSMTSSSPSSLPFKMSSSYSTNSKGRFLDFFRDGDKPVPPWKRSRRHQRSCRTGRCHGPRAPDLQEHLLGGRQQRPHAPNQSTCHGWE